ncbi:MAG TPA: hypothetical protein VLT45_28925 [Kofleriaceae bacterium]|nr:hypothetical protein [Kofleriaceae bacterium]
MRTKLLSALLLASTAIAGVASADPIVRDHRYDRNDRYSHRDRDDYRHRRPQYSWSGGVQVTSRPSWMPQVSYGYGAQVNYGYQVDADGDEVQPYSYGQDPYVEGIARGEWYPLGSGLRLAYNQQSKIDVNVSGQRLGALELQATGGRSWISEVHVELDDGRELKLGVNRFVDAVHAPNMRLDLGPSAQVGVRNIEIFGYSSGNGSFNVIGA